MTAQPSEVKKRTTVGSCEWSGATVAGAGAVVAAIAAAAATRAMLAATAAMLQQDRQHQRHQSCPPAQHTCHRRRRTMPLLKPTALEDSEAYAHGYG